MTKLCCMVNPAVSCKCGAPGYCQRCIDAMADKDESIVIAQWICADCAKVLKIHDNWPKYCKVYANKRD